MHIRQYIAAIFNGWVGWMSGIASIALTFSAVVFPQRFADPTKAKTALLVTGAVCFLIANYAAWRKERIAKEAILTTQKPFAKIRFAYEMGDNGAYLYVKNDGIIGEFFAQLRISGYRDDAHARWAHTNDVRTRIPTGMERRLLLAKLQYSRGMAPSSQWEIFYASENAGIGSHMATYSSMVGNRDAQAPDINLEVIIASDPDMRGGVQCRKIVLHSNRAEEL